MSSGKVMVVVFGLLVVVLVVGMFEVLGVVAGVTGTAVGAGAMYGLVKLLWKADAPPVGSGRPGGRSGDDDGGKGGPRRVEK